LSKLRIKTPRWSLPLLEPKRYKGAKGGRGSGKSHFFAELLVEEHVTNPDQQSVCIREIQKSLKFSAKKLIEDKIKALGVTHLFDITLTEIRSVNGDGIIIFQGMQDHTAESIKSLEGFDRAWVEEAQSLSDRSMELLLPTIRSAGSQIWFSWNPDQETDPVEQLFAYVDDDSECVHVNYTDNPFITDELLKEAEKHIKRRPDTFNHVWLGEFNTISDRYVFNGKYVVEEFEVDETFGDPYHGADFGFAQDPTTGVQCFIKNETLYIRHDCGKVGLELDYTAAFLKEHIPDCESYVMRADCARPESISYLKRHGLPNMVGVKKWGGSVHDGVEFIKSFDRIVIHPDCKGTILEFGKYSYKVDKNTGDILPVIVDAWNHYIDAIRYALAPLIKDEGCAFLMTV
jgi:phage terminase large subunit